jgi:hypothetical protein
MIDLSGSASVGTATEALAPPRFRLFHESIKLVIAALEGERKKIA